MLQLTITFSIHWGHGSRYVPTLVGTKESNIVTNKICYILKLANLQRKVSVESFQLELHETECLWLHKSESTPPIQYTYLADSAESDLLHTHTLWSRGVETQRLACGGTHQNIDTAQHRGTTPRPTQRSRAAMLRAQVLEILQCRSRAAIQEDVHYCIKELESFVIQVRLY